MRENYHTLIWLLSITSVVSSRLSTATAHNLILIEQKADASRSMYEMLLKERKWEERLTFQIVFKSSIQLIMELVIIAIIIIDIGTNFLLYV